MTQTLSLTGFTVKTENASYKYCPKATCELFETMGFIEGWEIDRNGEPVILFETENGYDGCLWNEFVSTFPKSHRIAEMVATYLSIQTIRRTMNATIYYLLQPLNVA